MQTARLLAGKLKDYSPLNEIILLGDILDLQLANWAQAVEGKIIDSSGRRAVGFRYFINFLIECTAAKSIIYIPGNHDYRIFDYHSVEQSLIRPLRTGKKLSGRPSFYRTFRESFLQGVFAKSDVRLKVVYPHYSMKVNGARLILTHGHFFDPTQAFSQEIGRLFDGSVSLSRKQTVQMRHEYFRRVSLYQNVVSGLSQKRQLRDWFNAIYQPYTAWTHGWKHRSRKTFLTPAMRKSIQQYVSLCCRPRKVDGVIFGHTHRAGKATLQDGSVAFVWNAGSFLRESKASPAGSFITIRQDRHTPLTEAVQVHVL
jgi:UDP-2,3-diacylglucosamine pyrophosphatase LpxH